MAQGGPALELAIGKGRIALPLASQSIRVDGIDISTAMVSRLLAKPGGHWHIDHTYEQAAEWRITRPPID